MTNDRPSDSSWTPSEDLLVFLRRDLVRLDSPIAQARLHGIQELTRQRRYDAVPRFMELLEDDSPVMWDGHITEVRMCALVGLQTLHYSAGSSLELESVVVRRPWRAVDMRAVFNQVVAKLTESQRSAVLERANATLEQRVRPDPAQVDDLRAYCVLQDLGLVSYDRQRPDPRTTLTPLQETIYAEQAATPRPAPCLRIALRDSPERTLGWIYRNPVTRGWAHDFSEHPAGGEASGVLSRIFTLGKNGIPNVVHDRSGQPLRSADGTFVLDGELAPDSGDEIQCLRSIAAFMNVQEFTAELLLPAEGPQQ